MNSKMDIQGTFWMFGFFAALGGVFIFYFMKETKGLSDSEKKKLYKENTPEENE